ncbi:MAG: hypothetical protein IJU53_01240 [Thermoguttaceae bacterium]|nr:hypothetical protein [Thermoguttaceae bacterium]
MKTTTFIWAFGILLLGFLSSELCARSWTIQEKQYDADFLRYSEEKVVLLLPEQFELHVPLEQLSKEDQEFLNKYHVKPAEKSSDEAREQAEKSTDEAKEQTEKSDIFSSVTYILLILVALGLFMLFWKMAFSRKFSQIETEESPKDSASDEPKTAPAILYIGDVLNGKRFNFDPELSQKAKEESKKQVDQFFESFDEEYPKLSPSVVPSQAVLQNIADRLNPEFTKNICARDSYWMGQIYGEDEEIPSDLASYVDNLLPPVQVPQGQKIKLEASAKAVGILAAFGAIIGAWLVCFFASTSGMKSPSDISVLVGATLGAGLLSGLIFWATANEVWRQRLLLLLGITAATDITVTIISKYLAWGRFFGIGRKFKFSLWKRILLYLATSAILMMMKRPVVFDRSDYQIQLQNLYYERIVSSVMLLALYKQQHQHLIDEQNEWKAEIERYKVLAEVNKASARSIEFIVPRIKSLWTLGISQIPPMMKALVQDFRLAGFDLPQEEMPWISQLPQSSKPAKETSQSKTFRWSDEKKNEYDCLGLLEEGDEVEILEEPIIQNGQVIKKGIVQEVY